MNYTTGQRAWTILQNLGYTGENSYKNFFKGYDLLYRPYYREKDQPFVVRFEWIINRDYCPKGYDYVESPPYWEMCVSLPPEPNGKGMHWNYSAPRFIWNNERGLKEIFIAAKSNYEI